MDVCPIRAHGFFHRLNIELRPDMSNTSEHQLPVPMSEHTLGIILVSASSAVFALTGVLTKSITADALVILCWRGLIGGLLMGVYVLLRSRGAAGAFRLGWRGWLLAAVGSLASIAFIAAFKYTYVANVAIIYATTPFLAGFLGFVLFRERMRTVTIAAASISICGVAFMVVSGAGQGNLFGDTLAFIMTAIFALYMVLVRQFRDTPAVWAGAVSALLLFVFGWFVTDPLAVTQNDMILLMLFGSTSALAIILWTEGARLLPAPETGLLGSSEVPFAMLFAWLFLAELPPLASVTGGVIVLAAVIWHAGRDLRREKIHAIP
jgi:drug/metabolite transporter (DMT)-like permease